MKPQPKSRQNNLGASGNNIHAARRFVATKPARAAMLDADKKHRRIPLQAEPATGRQGVKMQHRSILGTSVIAMQRLLNTATNHARQGHTRSIARDERTRIVGEVAQASASRRAYSACHSCPCGCTSLYFKCVSRCAASCRNTHRNRYGLRSPLTDISWKR